MSIQCLQSRGYCAQDQIKIFPFLGYCRPSGKIQFLNILANFFVSFYVHHFHCLDLKKNKKNLHYNEVRWASVWVQSPNWNSMVSCCRVHYNQRRQDNVSSFVSKCVMHWGTVVSIHFDSAQKHQTQSWYQIYSKEHLVGLMSSCSNIPLNTCPLKQMYFTDRLCLPTKPTVPSASVPLLLKSGTTARVTALRMQAPLAYKHFPSWQQRLIKINMCLRGTFRNL